MKKEDLVQGLQGYIEALDEVPQDKKFNISIQLRTLNNEDSPKKVNVKLNNLLNYINTHDDDQQFEAGINVVEDNPFNRSFGDLVQAKIKAKQAASKVKDANPKKVKKAKAAKKS